MKYFSIVKKALLFFVVLLFVSCVPRKDIVYYQDIDTLVTQKSNSYEIKIQPDDLLSINVSAEDAEISAPFNLNPINVVGGKQMGRGQGLSEPTYLVDANGYIDFPVLGKIKLSGLNRAEVLTLFHSKISSYIKDPIIVFRILNFKVAVQGQVNSPGVLSIDSDRFTLIEALTMAGDLANNGRRNNILIIRDTDGVKSFHRVDITKSDFMSSPFYYLAQNDVVYVEPRQTPINANLGLVMSISSFMITILSFVIATAK